MACMIRLILGIALILSLSSCGDPVEDQVEQKAENATQEAKEKLRKAAKTAQKKLREGADELNKQSEAQAPTLPARPVESGSGS